MTFAKGGVLLLSLSLFSGCTSIGYRESIATDEVSAAGFVEMVIVNRTEEAVRVIVTAVDRGGPPPPIGSPRVLGDLRGGQAMTTSINHRWRRISLTVEVFGRGDQPPLAPPTAVPGVPGVTVPGVPGGTVRGRSGPPVSGVQHGPEVEIGPGDRLQWEIARIGALWSVQLTAHEGPDPELRASPEGEPPSEGPVPGVVE